MKILAFDPGETTGIALATILPHNRCVSVRIDYIGVYSKIEQFHKLVISKIFEDINQVVIEDYIVYPNKAQAHAGSRVYTAREIGQIVYVAYTYGITEPIFQTASMAKQRWPDSRLKKYIEAFKSYNRHERDAIRHLLTWTERQFKRKLEVYDDSNSNSNSNSI